LSQWVELHFDEPVPVATVAEQLKQVAEIVAVDAPYVLRLNVKPSDELYDASWPFGPPIPTIDRAQWNLVIVNAEQAWDIARGYVGEGVPSVIGLSDDFFFSPQPGQTPEDHFLHPDLGEDPSLGLYGPYRLDNSAVSWNFGGHSTRVAGFAGAISDNEALTEGSIASLAWTAALRGFLATPVGIRQATCTLPGELQCAPVDVLNMSWSANDCSPDGPPDEIEIDCDELESALEDALGTSTILVGSTGNEHLLQDGTPCRPCRPWPGGYYSDRHGRGVLTVNATRSDETVNTGFNFSEDLDPDAEPSRAFMDLAAPGIDVLVLNTGGAGLHDFVRDESGGTSYSAPAASSLVALLLSINPDLTSDQVDEALIRTSEEVGPAGSYTQTGRFQEAWSPRYGYGRIDAAAAVRYAIEHFGGRIGGTSDGYGYFIKEPLTIHSGATVTLRPGTDLQVDANITVAAGGALQVEPGATLSFAAGKHLLVWGTLEAADATFTEAVGGQGWAGVVVAGGVSTITGGRVEHATTGVTVYDPARVVIDGTELADNGTALDVRSNSDGTQPGAVVEDALISGNTTGVRTDYVVCYGTTCTCLSGCRGRVSIDDSIVEDNSGTGIYALNGDAAVRNSCVRENTGHGITVANALVEPFAVNSLTENGEEETAVYGGAVLYGGDLRLSPLAQTGGNRLVANADAELYVATGGAAFAGYQNTSGGNAFIDTGGGTLVWAPSHTTIEARYNWWGASPPPSGGFPGPGVVDRANHLGADPTTDTCNPPGGGFAALAGEMPPEAIGDGEPQPVLEELRAGIRRLRDSLTADPGADRAAERVRALYALQRLDRIDVLGERAATMATLAALRVRLGEASLPSGLRASAEASLEMEAADALAYERYDEARALLDAYAGGVNGVRVQRALTLTRAFLEAHAGRREEAAVLVADVAAGLDDDRERRELLALAAALAQGAPTGAVSPEVAPLAGGVQMELGMSVTPNPLSGTATIRIDLPTAATVKVTMYDVLGRTVALLAEEMLTAGAHALRLDGGPLAAGVYVVRAEVQGADEPARALAARVTVQR
jgi:hypothetical protein